MLILLLDAYHLGDPLFLTGLARDLRARGSGLVLVHGMGERAERALESIGIVPAFSDGVWEVPTEEAREVIERAGRDLNRDIAHELNEAGVASIRVIGADRGLLKATPGGLRTGRVDWVHRLVDQGVVVVVAALVHSSASGLREVEAATAAAALARGLGGQVAVLASDRVGPEAKRLEIQWETALVLDRAGLRSGAPGAGPRESAAG